MMTMRIRRPLKSWRSSAAICGGWLRLMKYIVLCYMGSHSWGAVFFLGGKTAFARGLAGVNEQCQICGRPRP